MWPFKRTPQKVTADEFASALTELMRRSAKDFHSELEKHSGDMWELHRDEINEAGIEVFTAYLWMVSKVLGNDKEVLELLHHRYLSGVYALGEIKNEGGELADAAQSDLLARYEKYYKAWDDDLNAKGGIALSSEMANFFFPKRAPLFNAFLQSEIQVRIATFMATVVEFRKKFEIVTK